MKSNKNLVLVGMMGSGKSSIGKLLSKKLNFDFLDTLIRKKLKFGHSKEIIIKLNE